MAKKTISYDLNDPKQAREYVAGVRVDGNQIDWVEYANGMRMDIANMTDDQITDVAQFLWDQQQLIEHEGPLQ